MRINSRPAAIAAAVLVSALPISASAQTQTFTVDCARGQTISKALGQGDSRKPMLLIVRGTCNENITIARDDVTLQGQPGASATVSAASSGAATISIRATRVVLDGLTVIGGSNGIGVSGTMDVTIRSCTIQNAVQNGLMIANGFALAQSNTIQGNGGAGVYLRRAITRLESNGIQSNAGAGVYGELFSAISSQGNTITANGAQGITLYGGSQGSLNSDTISSNMANGIELDSASQVRLNAGHTITGNTANGIQAHFAQVMIYGATISNNNASGVSLLASRADIGASTISNNLAWGISAATGPTVSIDGSTISGNVQDGVMLDQNGTARIANTTIDYNGGNGIRLRRGSTLVLIGGNATSGNVSGYGLWCPDLESSYSGTLGGSNGVSCSSY